MDVAQFLDELGLSQYRQAFLDNAVDYELLPELSDPDLRELGVEALGHRKRIRQAAAKIASQETEAAKPESRAQRRQLTLMFADLADSTRLSDHLDLESYNEIIRTYQDTTKHAIEAHGGYVATVLKTGEFRSMSLSMSLILVDMASVVLIRRRRAGWVSYSPILGQV